MDKDIEEMLKAAIAARDEQVRRDERRNIARGIRIGIARAEGTQNVEARKAFETLAELLER